MAEPKPRTIKIDDSAQAHRLGQPSPLPEGWISGPEPPPTSVDQIRAAAQAFSDAYAEHLNHHCAKCTQAWDRLKAALEAVPPR